MTGRRPVVVVAGGGTGGHTSPGLAVVQVLEGRGVPCAWIGSRHGIEARRAPAHGIPYVAIPTGKLRRYWSWQTVPDLAVRVPAGIVRARGLLRQLGPRLVFATGGFVALPTVLAAASLGLPVVVHEQASVPGLANRVAARFARRIAVTWPESVRCFAPRPVIVTGNPLRAELRAGSRGDAIARFGLDPALPLVYVTGGAQGAHRINRALGDTLPEVLAATQVIHQCGDNRETRDREWLETRRQALEPALARRYHVVPYLDAELSAIFAAAALVVGRAGAGTVNECCQLGLAALYIPLPGTSGDEQAVNARLVERAGGAVVLLQSALTPASLAAAILGLVGAPGRLKEMGEHARALARPDAAERLADLIVDAAGIRGTA